MGQWGTTRLSREPRVIGFHSCSLVPAPRHRDNLTTRIVPHSSLIKLGSTLLFALCSDPAYAGRFPAAWPAIQRQRQTCRISWRASRSSQLPLPVTQGLPHPQV